MYSLNYLETFLNLGETLSFTESARSLKLSQPSVSRQIQLLEGQLGVSLFIRARNKVNLSQAGVELRARLSPLLGEVMTALGSTKRESEALRGTIAIGTLPDMGHSLFVPAALRFQKRYPEINLQVELLAEADIREKLKRGVIGFGVLSSYDRSNLFRAYPAFEERVVLLTSAGNKKDLTRGSVPSFVQYRSVGSLLDQFMKIHSKRLGIRSWRPLLIVNSHHSMLEALVEGDAYGVMPYFSAKPYIDAGKVRIASELELRSQIYFAHLENKHLDRKDLAFKRFFLEFFKGMKPSKR